jgi:hypothetical protein
MRHKKLYRKVNELTKMPNKQILWKIGQTLEVLETKLYY